MLGVDTVFNSIGFRHLIYKLDGTARHISEAIHKPTLFLSQTRLRFNKI